MTLKSKEYVTSCLVRFNSFPDWPNVGFLVGVALFYTRSSFTYVEKYAELHFWMLHWYSLVDGNWIRHSLSDCIRDGLCLQFPSDSLLLSKVLQRQATNSAVALSRCYQLVSGRLRSEHKQLAATQRPSGYVSAEFTIKTGSNASNIFENFTREHRMARC